VRRMKRSLGSKRNGMNDGSGRALVRGVNRHSIGFGGKGLWESGLF